MSQQPSFMDVLFKPRPQKPPRQKSTCNFCNTTRFGLERPNAPFCSLYCKAWFANCTEHYKPPNQYELPLHKPPDELVKLLRYP